MILIKLTSLRDFSLAFRVRVYVRKKGVWPCAQGSRWRGALFEESGQVCGFVENQERRSGHSCPADALYKLLG
ncbi:MAG: hypothetical protein EBS01_07120 [Verrucomicrobia bacterium]|nr:hypothetical protein [Verrucomicrobiota bacterium]